MSIAIIRDMYSGDYMARIMSFVTVVFILFLLLLQLWVNLFLTITTGMGFSIFRYLSVFCRGGFGNDNETLSIENKKNFQKRFYRGV
jgi:DHA1 family bicyclomycin/chloramphenicol resistance-like MFS transporter